MSNFPCSGCNADLQFSPGEGELECPYCGSTTTIESTAKEGEAPAAVIEYDLESALQNAPVGWASEVVEFQCKNCSAFTAVEPHVTATSCAFCGTNQLEIQPTKEDMLRPESLLPFAIEKDQAKDSFGTWVKSLWFRPNDLKSTSRLDGLKGVYIPIFTFDMKSSTDWNAQAGFHYYVTVTGSDGKSRRQRRTRWEWRSGNVRRSFDDWLVEASSGLSQELFTGLLPYDTSALVPYQAQFLAGFIAERYQISLDDAWQIGRSGMGSVIRGDVVSDIPGDTYRSLTMDTETWDKTFKHCLVPVWLSAYRYKEKTFHYVVNGVTGKMNGTAPYSWVKITLAVLLGMGVVAGIVWAAENG
jgi:Zn finger protein HypA/HybF involved in hydrogenase expression